MIIVLGVWLGLSSLSFLLIMGCCIVAARADKAQDRIEQGLRLRRAIPPVARTSFRPRNAFQPRLLTSQITYNQPPQRPSPS